MITGKSFKILFLFAFAVFLFFIINSAYALKTETLQSEDVTILFEETLSHAAKEVIDLYPFIKTELKKVIGWEINFRPTIILIKDDNTFQRMAGNDLIVAFALPRQKQVIINYSKVIIDPFNLEATLQHELCHLLLHNYISDHNLPRWLDEGVAQWVSGGLADIIINNRDSILNSALLSGRFLRIRTLENNFPSDKKSMTLAYAESRSFVTYIIREYKLQGILLVLQYLNERYNIDDAIMKAFNISYKELEIRWKKDIQSRNTLLLFLTGYLYEILFLAGAFLLILGYIKVIIKKKKYDQDNYEE